MAKLKSQKKLEEIHHDAIYFWVVVLIILNIDFFNLKNNYHFQQ